MQPQGSNKGKPEVSALQRRCSRWELLSQAIQILSAVSGTPQAALAPHLLPCPGLCTPVHTLCALALCLHVRPLQRHSGGGEPPIRWRKDASCIENWVGGSEG